MRSGWPYVGCTLKALSLNCLSPVPIQFLTSKVGLPETAPGIGEPEIKVGLFDIEMSFIPGIDTWIAGCRISTRYIISAPETLIYNNATNETLRIPLKLLAVK